MYMISTYCEIEILVRNTANQDHHNTDFPRWLNIAFPFLSLFFPLLSFSLILQGSGALLMTVNDSCYDSATISFSCTWYATAHAR